jgi:hypothetical protein
LLGIVGFFGSAASLLFVAIYFWCRKDLRCKYNLDWLPQNNLGKDGVMTAEEKAREEEEEARDRREVIQEGLYMMASNFSSTLVTTVTTYIAFSRGQGVSYTLASASNLSSIIGPQFCGYTALFTKIYGSQLLAKRMYTGYYGVALASLGVNLLVGIATTIFMFHCDINAFAAFYGAQACTFAGVEACAPIFETVFPPDGVGGLATNMKIWGLLSVPECVLSSVVPLLNSMCEFRFLAVTGIGALVFVYIPAIIVVSVVPSYSTSPTAYMVAQYLPDVALMFVYSWRVMSNLRAMQEGRAGSWDTHARLDVRVSRASSRHSSELMDVNVGVSPVETGTADDAYVEMDDAPEFAGEEERESRIPRCLRYVPIIGLLIKVLEAIAGPL